LVATIWILLMPNRRRASAVGDSDFWTPSPRLPIFAAGCPLINSLTAFGRDFVFGSSSSK
jgi:hypothetical protein